MSRPKDDDSPRAEQPAAGRATRGTVAIAVLAELREAKKETSALGQACLAVARRVDAGGMETGSAFASLSRELRAALEAAVGVTAGQSDVLDELAEQRRKRLSGAGS